MGNSVEKPTNVRYGVLGFACVLSMVTYLDRVCFGTVAPYVQAEFGLKSEDMGWIFGGDSHCCGHRFYKSAKRFRERWISNCT